MCSERWLATRKCRLIWSYGCGHRHQHHISWSRGRESMMNVRRRGSSRALADWKVAQDKEGKNGQRGFGAWLSKDAADERVVWCVCVSAEKRGLRGETEAREEGGGGKRSAEKDERAEDKRTEGMGADWGSVSAMLHALPCPPSLQPSWPSFKRFSWWPLYWLDVSVVSVTMPSILTTTPHFL